MKKINILWFFTVGCMLTSCIGNKYSYMRKGEEVHLNIKHFQERVPDKPVRSVLAMNETSKARGGAALMVLPYAFKLGYNQIEKMIVNEDKKHSATYKASASDDKFYKDYSETAQVNVDKITLFRTIQVNKNERDTAFVISFTLEKTADGMFLRLIPERLKVNYTKAKLKRCDRNLDLDFAIDVITFWLDNDKSFKSEKFGPLEMTLYNIPLRRELVKKDLEQYASTWFSIIPRSQIEEGSYGTGNYSLSVSVKEYDEIGAADIKYSDKFNFEGNREDVKGFIDNTTNELKLKQQQQSAPQE